MVIYSAMNISVSVPALFLFERLEYEDVYVEKVNKVSLLYLCIEYQISG